MTNRAFLCYIPRTRIQSQEIRQCLRKVILQKIHVR